MTKSADVFRPSLTAAEINSLIYELQLIKANRPLEPDAEKALVKLTVLNFKVSQGITKPSYVNTGKKITNANLMDALSVDAPKPTVIVDRRGNPDAVDLSNYTDEQIEDAKERELFEFTVSGNHTDWHIYLPKLIPTVERRKEELDKDDDDDSKFADMFGKL